MEPQVEVPSRFTPAPPAAFLIAAVGGPCHLPPVTGGSTVSLGLVSGRLRLDFIHHLTHEGGEGWMSYELVLQLHRMRQCCCNASYIPCHLLSYCYLS